MSGKKKTPKKAKGTSIPAKIIDQLTKISIPLEAMILLLVDFANLEEIPCDLVFQEIRHNKEGEISKKFEAFLSHIPDNDSLLSDQKVTKKSKNNENNNNIDEANEFKEETFSIPNAVMAESTQNGNSPIIPQESTSTTTTTPTSSIQVASPMVLQTSKPSVKAINFPAHTPNRNTTQRTANKKAVSEPISLDDFESDIDDEDEIFAEKTSPKKSKKRKRVSTPATTKEIPNVIVSRENLSPNSTIMNNNNSNNMPKNANTKTPPLSTEPKQKKQKVDADGMAIVSTSRSVMAGWTEEENERLRVVVKMHTPENGRTLWNFVAKDMGDWSASQCFQHYSRVVAPEINRGTFTLEEDLMLWDMLERPEFWKAAGMPSWARLADGLPGRTDIQVRYRYNNHIKPALEQTWTPEEDEKLLSLVANHDIDTISWKKVARDMLEGKKGFKADSCCFRWISLMEA